MLQFKIVVKSSLWSIEVNSRTASKVYSKLLVNVTKSIITTDVRYNIHIIRNNERYNVHIIGNNDQLTNLMIKSADLLTVIV